MTNRAVPASSHSGAGTGSRSRSAPSAGTRATSPRWSASPTTADRRVASVAISACPRPATSAAASSPSPATTPCGPPPSSIASPVVSSTATRSATSCSSAWPRRWAASRMPSRRPAASCTPWAGCCPPRRSRWSSGHTCWSRRPTRCRARWPWPTLRGSGGWPSSPRPPRPPRPCSRRSRWPTRSCWRPARSTPVSCRPCSCPRSATPLRPGRGGSCRSPTSGRRCRRRPDSTPPTTSRRCWRTVCGSTRSCTTPAPIR